MNYRCVRHLILGEEDGTTMTEFVMTLPMFILCFIGVIHLGHFSEISVRTWSRAHRNTFQVALLPTHVQFSPHAQPTLGGGLGLGTLALGDPNSTTGVQRALYMTSETATYGAMMARGHWGESFARTLPVSAIVDMQFIEGPLPTSNSDQVIGGSSLARDLVDESVGVHTGSGSGALAGINSLVTSSGLRPAIAAGMRYGAVGAWADDTHSVAGRSISTRATFNTLVPPFPLTGAQAQFLPTAVVRITMENHGPYKEILGVKFSQPYNGSGFSTGSDPGLGFPL